MWNFNHLWWPSWILDFTEIQSQPTSWRAEHTHQVSRRYLKRFSFSWSDVVSQCEISITYGGHLGFQISLKFNSNLPLDMLNTPTKFHKDISNGFPFIGRTSFLHVIFQSAVAAMLDFRFYSNSIPTYLLTCLTHPPSITKISRTVFLLLVGRRFCMWNFNRLWRPCWISDFTQIQSQPTFSYA